MTYNLRDALQHVLWIGGPPDAGKSTVADILGKRYGLPVYHMDRHELDHIRRADATLHPATYALRAHLDTPDDPALVEEGWVRHTPEEMAASARASWEDRIGLVVEDLRALPRDRPIVAEGPGFFPAVILPLISDSRQAIWLVPAEAFKRASHARRGKSAFRFKTSDPERAYRNHVERDLLLAEAYRRAARELGLPMIEVDGSMPPEELASAVAAHFGSLLAAALL